MLSSNKDNYGDHCIEFQGHEFWSIGQIAGYYFHVVVLWVKLQATVLGVCWAIFLSL